MDISKLLSLVEELEPRLLPDLEKPDCSVLVSRGRDVGFPKYHEEDTTGYKYSREMTKFQKLQANVLAEWIDRNPFIENNPEIIADQTLRLE